MKHQIKRGISLKAFEIGEPALTTQDDGECGGFLLLPDGNRFTVDVTHWEGSAAPLCDVADEVVSHARDVLNRGRFPRRPHPYPDGSIALDYKPVKMGPYVPMERKY